MNKQIAIYVFLGIMLMMSCSHAPNYPHELILADSLADIRPDSAQRLLQSMDKMMEDAPSSSRHYYELLCVKADDKAFKPITDRDSLILALVGYYEKVGDRQLLPVAYYYAGRLCAELNDGPQALLYFQQALDHAPSSNSIPLNVIYAQMASMFILQGLTENALHFNKLAYQYDLDAGDSLGMVFDLRDIGVHYGWQEQYDSSYTYLKKAYSLAREMSSKLMECDVAVQMASHFYDRGLYDSATVYISNADSGLDKPRLRPFYSIRAEVELAQENLDSARHYYRLLWGTGTVYARRTAARGLAKVEGMLGRSDSALYYLNEFLLLEDTVRSMGEKETMARMQSQYDYSIHEERARRMEGESVRRGNVIVILLLVVLIVSLSLSFAVVNSRRQKKFLRLKIDSLEANKYIVSVRTQEELDMELALLKQTGIYNEILSLLENTEKRNKSLSDGQWEELDKMVNDIYKGFKRKLYDTCSMRKQSYRMCLLLKVQIPPSKIAQILSVEVNSISMARKRLYEKAFGKKGKAEDWDVFIKSL
ncbi:MAG: hypothetical protein IKX24_01900 [Prevotella sp.]|nr:hypothetical protein [Prevotella sp.]MBR5060877.1 hypothetical protein [Prevotella sp.]